MVSVLENRTWSLNFDTCRRIRNSLLQGSDYLFTYFHTFLLSYFLTYLLTPWYRVLLEKLTGLQLVKKFPAFHGTRRFITTLTSVRQLSLSCASPIQSIYPHPASWRSVIILSTHLSLGLLSGFLHSSFPSKTLYTSLSSPIRATSFFSILSPAQYWVRGTNHLTPRYAISSIPPWSRLQSESNVSSIRCISATHHSTGHGHSKTSYLSLRAFQIYLCGFKIEWS